MKCDKKKFFILKVPEAVEIVRRVTYVNAPGPLGPKALFEMFRVNF